MLLRRSRWHDERPGDIGGVVDTDLNELTRFIAFGVTDGQWNFGQIRVRLRQRSQNDVDISRVQPLGPSRFDRIPAPPRAGQLPALRCQAKTQRAFASRHPYTAE